MPRVHREPRGASSHLWSVDLSRLPMSRVHRGPRGSVSGPSSSRVHQSSDASAGAVKR